LLCTTNVEQKSCFTPIILEQKSCFAPKIFEQKSFLHIQNF
jgi:hypothetical protein